MSLDRRKFLAGAGLASSAALGAGVLGSSGDAIAKLAQQYEEDGDGFGTRDEGAMRAEGTTSTDDFDPYSFLTEFDWGSRVEDLGDGRKRRFYQINAIDETIEVAPGVEFPCWTYNGQVPGPTLRANEGDEIVIRFRNDGSHPHTMHFHGIHTPEMDGIPGLGDGMIETGDETVYRFTAEPYGTHLYHCHSVPLKRHIHKGLYGAFVVDPPGGYDEAFDGAFQRADRELVMVMNGFDTNFDGDNEIYAVNTKAFSYAEQPIEITQDELVRVFLVNTTEFDPVNSFHLHAHFFDYYDTGRLENRRTWVDTIMQCQAQRGMLQFRAPFPGKLMFHAHQSEFAELGWLGFFDVQENPDVDGEARARSSERGPADPRYGSNAGNGSGGGPLEGGPEPPSTTARGAAEPSPYRAGAADSTSQATAGDPQSSSASRSGGSAADATREAIERVIEDSGGSIR